MTRKPKKITEDALFDGIETKMLVSTSKPRIQ